MPRPVWYHGPFLHEANPKRRHSTTTTTQAIIFQAVLLSSTMKNNGSFKHRARGGRVWNVTTASCRSYRRCTHSWLCDHALFQMGQALQLWIWGSSSGLLEQINNGDLTSSWNGVVMKRGSRSLSGSTLLICCDSSAWHLRSGGEVNEVTAMTHQRRLTARLSYSRAAALRPCMHTFQQNVKLIQRILLAWKCFYMTILPLQIDERAFLA